MTSAIYAGSFDPFTNGHLDIVKKASTIFDKVIIVIAINVKKTRTYRAYDMCSAISKTLQENQLNNCMVVTYDGLVAELAYDWGVPYLIRGLRNAQDYSYEEEMSKINAELNPEIETIYFRSNQDIVSSSLIKELYGLKYDVSEYVPSAVLKLMEECK